MSENIQVCLDTLAFDEIDEIFTQNNQLCVKLCVYTPFSQYCFESCKSLREIYEYIQHIQKHGFMLLTLDKKEIDQLIAEIDRIKKIKILNKFFKEILIRRDLITKQKVKFDIYLETVQLLGLNQEIEIYSKQEALIPSLIMGFKLSDSNLTVSQMMIVDQIIIITLENQSQLQKFGKIWNLIEPEVMGQLLIYKIGEVTPFQKYVERHFSFKLFCLDLVDDQIVIGTCQGSFLIYDRQTLHEKHQVQLLTTPIYKLKYFNQEIYIVTDNSVKIINKQNFQLIGGGSLKNRLQNSWITSLNFDEKEKLLFLGTSSGFILAFKRSEKLEFVGQINFNCNMVIKSIQITDCYLYPCTEMAVPILSYKLVDNQLQYQEKTAFASTLKLEDFIKQKELVLGITNCGQVVQWNSENGQMNQAYKVDKNFVCGLFFDGKLYVATNEQMLHIVSFK